MNTKSQEHLTFVDPNIWKIFVNNGEIVEVRVLGAGGKHTAWGNEYARGIVSGYFNDHEKFWNAVKLADKAKHDGIYFTLQIIDTRLIGRTYNRLKPATLTTSDHNVTAYRWLPVDIDPVRPAGISSSDSELQAALDLRDPVARWVMDRHRFKRPLQAISGNGGHLLFRFPKDVPISDESTFHIKSTLDDIARRFNTDRVKVDSANYNPARIWKLYGTTARKGDPVPAGKNREARPHRQSYIDDIGDCHE